MLWKLSTERVARSREPSVVPNPADRLISPSRTSCYNRDMPIYKWYRQYKFISHSCKVYLAAERKDKRRREAVLCSMVISKVPCWQKLSHFPCVSSKVAQGIIPSGPSIWGWDVRVVHWRCIAKSLVRNRGHTQAGPFEKGLTKGLSIKMWAGVSRLSREFHNL